MSAPTIHVFGTIISTYTRIVETVAEEAGIAWEIHATPANSPQNRHPFGKVPVVEIDGLELFESVAIAHYIDNAHNDGALQPADPKLRAEMDRWIAIANNYVFETAEHGLIMPRLAHEHLKVPLREDIIERALPEIGGHLALVCDRIEQVPYMAGPDFSLADIFIYCVLRGIQLTPEGGRLIDALLPLRHWMNRLGQRDSLVATRWPVENAE